ncbi:hypothetical protein V8E53_001594 [Lactarius tabidus]
MTPRAVGCTTPARPTFRMPPLCTPSRIRDGACVARERRGAQGSYTPDGTRGRAHTRSWCTHHPTRRVGGRAPPAGAPAWCMTHNEGGGRFPWAGPSLPDSRVVLGLCAAPIHAHGGRAKGRRGPIPAGSPFAWHPHTNGGEPAAPLGCPLPSSQHLLLRTPTPLGGGCAQIGVGGKVGGGGGTHCHPLVHPPLGRIHPGLRRGKPGRARTAPPPSSAGRPASRAHGGEGGRNGGGTFSAPCSPGREGAAGGTAPSPTWRSTPAPS